MSSKFIYYSFFHIHFPIKCIKSYNINIKSNRYGCKYQLNSMLLVLLTHYHESKYQTTNSSTGNILHFMKVVFFAIIFDWVTYQNKMIDSECLPTKKLLISGKCHVERYTSSFEFDSEKKAYSNLKFIFSESLYYKSLILW